MYAIELNGTHIGKKFKFTYRYKSWKKDRPSEQVVVVLNDIHHKRDGRIFLNKNTKLKYVPFDAVVEEINDEDNTR